MERIYCRVCCRVYFYDGSCRCVWVAESTCCIFPLSRGPILDKRVGDEPKVAAQHLRNWFS